MQKLFQLVLLFALTPFMAASNAADEIYKEGVNYEVLSNPPAAEHGDKITVTEFFWYGCPHCYSLEPFVVSWLKTKPEGVEFKRMPAGLNPSWEFNAKAYFAMEIMGVTANLHEAVFESVNKDRKPLMSEPELLDFVEKHGVDREKFKETLNSFEVDGMVRHSNLLAGQYRLQGVPNVIVNNKYRVDAALAGGPDKLFKVVDFLIAKESTKH